jgi:pyruvate dehydrogenase kinase 2/3/4
MAQRAYDLLTLPHGLNETPAILQVAQVYLLYLKQFQECPIPDTIEKEEQFTQMLQHMILERSSIPNAIAKGIDSWIQQTHHSTTNQENEDARRRRDHHEEHQLQDMEDALYRFFTARVGLRFLTQHHIMSNPKRLLEKQQQQDSNHKDPEDDFFLGCIQTNCQPVTEVRKVVDYVRQQTQDMFGVCPEIQIVDAQQQYRQQKQPPPPPQQRGKGGGGGGNFTYVPHHLRYMVGELLKNSCRATVRR